MAQHLQVTINIPGRGELEQPGTLHLEENGSQWIEFQSDSYSLENMFVPVIYTTDNKTGEEYTCIQCHLKETDFGSCSLHITELIIGEHSPSAIEPYYKGAEVQINDLNDWMGKILFQFSSSQKELTAKTLPNQTFTYSIANGTALIIETWCHSVLNRQKVFFETRCKLNIQCEQPARRLDLFTYLTDFLRLYSLFTVDMTSFAKIELIDRNDERKELKRRDIKIRETSSGNTQPHLQNEIEPYFNNIIEDYYKNASKWRTIFDLLNESRLNKTREVSYLNITTALEILHKTFFAEGNDALMARYNEILLGEGVFDRKQKTWVNATRYYHLLKETRDIPFFEQRISDRVNMVRLMRNTRNWYTHYDELKGKIWTPAQLSPINNLLEGLVKAMILQTIGLPKQLINKLLSVDAHIFFNNYEANQYSLSYREDSFGNNTTTTNRE